MGRAKNAIAWRVLVFGENRFEKRGVEGGKGTMNSGSTSGQGGASTETLLKIGNTAVRRGPQEVQNW